MSEAQRQQMTKKPSWRVHVPARIISFTDGVYGTFHEDLARCCGDFVVRRADDMYAYQLAVSVDDGAMAVTHVLRRGRPPVIDGPADLAHGNFGIYTACIYPRPHARR